MPAATGATSKLDRAPLVQFEKRAEWRAWLEANHATTDGAWLVTWRKTSGRPVLDYEDAIQEALCFGWVDNRPGPVDEQRVKLYFAPRRERSTWSASNKARVERLIAAGLMRPAGLAAIERAKANGSWTSLDAVERAEVPDDLAAALAADPAAEANFAAFTLSIRKLFLAWVASARRPATRDARIAETVRLAAANELLPQWRPRE